MKRVVHIRERVRNHSVEFSRFLTTYWFRKTRRGISINIVGSMELLKLNKRDDCVLGIVYLHGEGFVIIDLQKKLGLGATDVSDDGCILLTEAKRDGEDFKVGMVVKDIADVLAIINNEAEVLQSGAPNYYDHCGSAGSEYLSLSDVLMDIDNIVSAIDTKEFESM